MKKIIFLPLAFFLVISSPMKASDVKRALEYAIIMPGQNGAGGDTFEQCNVVNTRPENTKRYQTLTGRTIDFGQGNCIAHFEEQYSSDINAQGKNRLFYGVSQGTATLTNWLAQHPHAKQNQIAKLLVLEGVLGSGNSAIMHTVESAWPVVTYLPFARAWLPWAVKVARYPTYNPWGKQALASARKLSPALPTVIMHNQGDQQLPINDAREYYCTQREQGNNSAYLMEVDNGAAHFDVLSNGYRERVEKIKALQAIYRKHGLPTAQESVDTMNQDQAPVDLNQYQPTVPEVRQRIRATNGYKNVLRNTIDIVSGALILGGIWWKFFSKR